MLVVIPAIAQHQETVAISLSRLRVQLPESRFLIVTPNVDAYARFAGGTVQVAHDNEFAPLSKAELRDALEPSKRTLVGWYYQQLLKYAVVAATNESSVLVLDADTVLLRTPDLAHGTFHTSKEHNAPYFAHYRQLTGLAPILRASAIVNFMHFDPGALREMLQFIEKRHSDSWWNSIIKIANSIDATGGFSEYETYANWFASAKGHHIERPFHLFRRGDLLLSGRVDQRAAVDAVERRNYDGIAFELNHHASVLKRLAVRAILAMNLRRW